MSLIKKALIEEILDRTAKSKELYEIIKSAKTNIKKKTFMKKIRANNTVLADLLTKLDTLTNKTYNNTEK